MLLQIALFLAWAFFNLSAKPSFGDAIEYFERSIDLKLDEYRPILYPLVIRAARWLGARARVPYQVYVYLFQTLVSFLCMLFAVRVADATASGRPDLPKTTRRHLFLAAYVWSFPLVGFMGFAGMSDSLALSMTVLFLSGVALAFVRNRLSTRLALLLFLSFFVGGLVRGDRPYLFLVFALLAAALAFFTNKGRARAAALVASLACLSFLAVRAVDRLTQEPGCHGRPRTTPSFVLLDRIVWPHMRECYYEFPLEVRHVVSIADARNFDADNNNVMYVFAKKMNGQIGEEKAQALYRTMAAVVWKNRTRRVAGRIVHDVAKTSLAPFYQVADIYIPCDRIKKKRRCLEPYCYNPRSFKKKAPKLTWLFNAFSLHLFAAFFVIASFHAAIRRRLPRRIVPFLAAFFGFSLVLALFYGLGDGAYPNSRYSIVVDVSWIFALLSLAGLLPCGSVVAPAQRSGR